MLGVIGRLAVGGPSLNTTLHTDRLDRSRFSTTLVAGTHEPGAHIVHTHTAKAGAVGRAAAIACRVPVIVQTFHGHVLREYCSPGKTALYRRLEAVLARGRDCLLAVSNLVQAELLELGVGRSEQYPTEPLGAKA